MGTPAPTFPPFIDYNPQTPISAAWLNAVTQALFGGNGAGNTRPTTNLYLGMVFLDLTLGPHGQPVFLAQITPTSIWVNSAGVQV